MIFKKALFSDTGPNVHARYVWTAVSYMLPWNWGNMLTGDSHKAVEEWLCDNFEVQHAYLFDSGRSALYHALQALGIGEGDEVLVQGYTCVVVTNAITYLGATPVYVDIDETLTLDPHKVEAHITSKTRAIIIQHTFGRIANLPALLALAKKHNVATIEDCAHALGGTTEGHAVGTMADIGMYSFGSDKIASCIRGGALVTQSQALGDVIERLQAGLPVARRVETLQHLLYYPVFVLGRALYSIYIGKVLFALTRRLSIVANLISVEEKRGEKKVGCPHKMPNALAHILHRELLALNTNSTDRKRIHSVYSKHLHGLSYLEIGEEEVPLYFVLFNSDPATVQRALKKRGIHLSQYWTGETVVPKGIENSVTRYIAGQCPVAERMVQSIITLPIDRHITVADAERVCKEILLCTAQDK